MSHLKVNELIFNINKTGNLIILTTSTIEISLALNMCFQLTQYKCDLKARNTFKCGIRLGGANDNQSNSNDNNSNRFVYHFRCV